MFGKTNITEIKERHILNRWESLHQQNNINKYIKQVKRIQTPDLEEEIIKQYEKSLKHLVIQDNFEKNYIHHWYYT